MAEDPAATGKTRPRSRAAREGDVESGTLRLSIEKIVSSEEFYRRISSLTVARAADTAPSRKGNVPAGDDADTGGFSGDEATWLRKGHRTKAQMRRFIAVLDTVYARILNDGGFDFTGFMRARGLGPSAMVDVLEAAAVRLGEEWRCDTKGFVRVTIGVSRLQRILTQMVQENRCTSSGTPDRSALIAVPRGETHLFAASLLEERFRLAGCETRTVIGADAASVRAHLKSGDFSAFCLVWLDESVKGHVEALLRGLRTAEYANGIKVMAGGQAALRNVDWLSKRGVDHVGDDMERAVAMVMHLSGDEAEAKPAAYATGSSGEPAYSA